MTILLSKVSHHFIPFFSLKLSDLVGYLDATDRVPARTVADVHIGVAAVEVEAVGVVEERAGRPIGAVDASIVGIAVTSVAAAGSREEHLRSIGKIRIVAC